MIEVSIHFFHREGCFLTESALRFLFFSQPKLCANLAIILLAFGDVFEPIADLMETGVAVVAVHNFIAFII